MKASDNAQQNRLRVPISNFRWNSGHLRIPTPTGRKRRWPFRSEFRQSNCDEDNGLGEHEGRRDQAMKSPQIILHAIEFKVATRKRYSLIHWFDGDAGRELMMRPPGSPDWLDLKVGDSILVCGQIKYATWTRTTITEVRLHSVSPQKFNGTVVTSAREWLEGR